MIIKLAATLIGLIIRNGGQFDARCIAARTEFRPPAFACVRAVGNLQASLQIRQRAAFPLPKAARGRREGRQRALISLAIVSALGKVGDKLDKSFDDVAEYLGFDDGKGKGNGKGKGGGKN